jgi:hypothetical protein
MAQVVRDEDGKVLAQVGREFLPASEVAEQLRREEEELGCGCTDIWTCDDHWFAGEQ